MRDEEKPLWYCPFYKKTLRSEDRRTICCEGGSRVVFEDYPLYDGFARRYCRSAGYCACSVARARNAYWGVDDDGG